jgi:hypothetical protein
MALNTFIWITGKTNGRRQDGVDAIAQDAEVRNR